MTTQGKRARTMTHPSHSDGAAWTMDDDDASPADGVVGGTLRRSSLVELLVRFRFDFTFLLKKF